MWIETHTKDAYEIMGKPFVLEELGATGAGSGAVIQGATYSVATRARRAEEVERYYKVGAHTSTARDNDDVISIHHATECIDAFILGRPDLMFRCKQQFESPGRGARGESDRRVGLNHMGRMTTATQHEP